MATNRDGIAVVSTRASVSTVLRLAKDPSIHSRVTSGGTATKLNTFANVYLRADKSPIAKALFRLRLRLRTDVSFEAANGLWRAIISTGPPVTIEFLVTKDVFVEATLARGTAIVIGFTVASYRLRPTDTPVTKLTTSQGCEHNHHDTTNNESDDIGIHTFSL